MRYNRPMAPISVRNRWHWFGVVFVYAWALYFASNQQTILAAHALPLSAVDKATPFLPWTGWIYSIVFILPIFACLAARTDEDVRWLVLSFTGLTTFDALVFFAFPTVYPRPVMAAAGLAALPLTIVHLLDTAKNCFPSQHVSTAVLTALHVRRLAPARGPVFLLLAAAIAASTLTTKQHYFWDVIAGALAGGAAYRLAAPRRNPD